MIPNDADAMTFAKAPLYNVVANHLLVIEVEVVGAPFVLGVPDWLPDFSLLSASTIFLYIFSSCSPGGFGSRGQNPAT
jgi:hypothetical protein